MLENFLAGSEAVVKFNDATGRRSIGDCGNVGRIDDSIYREDAIIIGIGTTTVIIII